jgi:uncharacterized caspase-like protein
LRISDYTRRLADLPLKASFVIVDAARANRFAQSGQPLAGGLVLTGADPNMLVAFNAAPGTVAPDENGPYGAYAKALAEMIREGGLSPSEVFDGVRLRVSEETKGAEVPWHTSRISVPFVFFERAADAPPPALAMDRVNTIRSRPLRDLGAQDAYAVAIERDSVKGYEDFLAAYPSDPLAGRIRALLAARREAITWRRTCRVNTADAYWSYLSRYPNGPHVADARWRLEALAVPEAPPPSFTPIVYDVAPPPPAEIVYLERPVLILNDPVFAFVPPPPIVFLAPPPPDFVVLPPPIVFVEAFVLPIPVFVPLPIWCNPPPFVAPPINNFIFNNIHNTVIVNNTTNIVTVKNSAGQVVSATPIKAAAAGTPEIGARLPPSVAKKGELMHRPGATANPAAPGQPAAPGHGTGALPSVVPAPGKGQLGQPLPGMGGHALPPIPGRAVGAPHTGAPAANAPATAPSSLLRGRRPSPHALPLQQNIRTPSGALAASRHLPPRVLHTPPPARFGPTPRPARPFSPAAKFHRAPAYRAPGFHAPASHAPAYRAPAFHAPAYRAPPRAAGHWP